jgi:hypothetical protein
LPSAIFTAQVLRPTLQQPVAQRGLGLQRRHRVERCQHGLRRERLRAERAGQLVAGLQRRELEQPVRVAAQPGRKPGIGDSVAKTFRRGNSVLQRLDHALDQRVAKAHPFQAGLGVADGIENGGAGRAGSAGAAASSSSGVMLSAIAVVSATSTKISGSSGRRGWKKP